jgi:hypothetical protein
LNKTHEKNYFIPILFLRFALSNIQFVVIVSEKSAFSKLALVKFAPVKFALLKKTETEFPFPD